MENLQIWLARSPLASALRVFVAVVLSMAVAQWVAAGSIDFGAWEVWVIAALSSCLPTLIRYINPADVEFGKGSGVADPFDVWGEE